METTIRVSKQTREHLDKMRLFDKESYNDIINLLIEDHLDLNEKTKKEIAEARKNIKRGEFYTEEEAKKILNV